MTTPTTNSQLFKYQIPNEYLFAFLDEIIINKTDNTYILSNEAYKRGMLFNKIPEFLNYCMEYYHKSKRFYLTRPCLYNNFTTIIRQICNNNCIKIEKRISFHNSIYENIWIITKNQS
jgi:hypothetical protein